MSHYGWMRRYDPWKKLEDFEAKHGTHVELLNKLTHDQQKNRPINRLLRLHHELVLSCIAFEAGYTQGLEAFGRR